MRFAVAFSALMLLSVPAAAADVPPPDAVSVAIDHAKVLRLPSRTQTVIVGNPMIADVSIQKNGVLVLTGKSFGQTNLIALDGGGTMLAESLISVESGGESVVTVQRGLARESYSCTPSCQPLIQIGDTKEFFKDLGEQTEKRNGLATSK